MFNFPLSPPRASTFAERYDLLFGAITALTIFFTVIVLTFVVIFAVRYRVGSSANRDRPQNENMKIEIAWSLPPLLLGIAIFAWGANDFVWYKTPPKDAMEIFVIGKQWMWHIQQPNGVRENNEIHVPIGKPVKLTMISQDVLHAMYIPAFRVQYHVVPGRYTSLWFQATQEGRFPMFCAQHCGTQHSEMGGYVYVMSQKDYATWLARGGSNPQPGGETIESSGKELFTQLRCDSCHGAADTELGPSLNGLTTRTRKLNTGMTVQVDDEYLRESIVDPGAKIVSGYINTMPQDYKNQLNEEQIRSLIQYMKSLGATPAPAAAKTAAAPGGDDLNLASFKKISTVPPTATGNR